MKDLVVSQISQCCSETLNDKGLKSKIQEVALRLNSGVNMSSALWGKQMKVLFNHNTSLFIQMCSESVPRDLQPPHAPCAQNRVRGSDVETDLLFHKIINVI